MTVHTGGTVIVFFPLTNRLHGDPEVRRDALLSREVLAGTSPATKVPAQWSGCLDAAVVPIDGLGRTVPGLVSADGVLGLDLWQRFARAEPELVADRELWERSGQGEVEVETSYARIVLGATHQDEGKVKLELAYSGYAPDPLADRATTKLESGTVPWNVRWPEPFGPLFPGAAALEAMMEQMELERVLALASEGSRQEALAAAETALEQRRYDVTMPSLGVFWQIAREHDGDASVLFEAEGGLDIEAPDWETLKSNSRFLERVRKPTVMPYLVGILGYIWWQTVEALREGYVPRCCGACGRLLPADVTGRRRFCSQAENPSCRRERHRQLMRRQRLRSL